MGGVCSSRSGKPREPISISNTDLTKGKGAAQRAENGGDFKRGNGAVWNQTNNKVNQNYGATDATPLNGVPQNTLNKSGVPPTETDFRSQKQSFGFDPWYQKYRPNNMPKYGDVKNNSLPAFGKPEKLITKEFQHTTMDYGGQKRSVGFEEPVTSMNAQQCQNALKREREIHQLKMKGLQNRLELQYKTRLSGHEQSYLKEIGQLENKIKELKQSYNQPLPQQGYQPVPYGTHISGSTTLSPWPVPYDTQMSGLTTLTPGPCPGGCGRRLL